MKTVKKLSKYVYDTKEHCDEVPEIVVEHRSNNSKRDFLFVNKNQCKHIPSSPTKMLSMCYALADLITKLKPSIHYRELLVVGFAETATAIANAVAYRLCSTDIIMTTREYIDGSVELLNFEEEHSHATEQMLLTYNDKPIDLRNYDYILFVDDEISTGNTILNFVNEIQKKYPNTEFEYGVASICNWQDDKAKEKFNSYGIETYCLISGTLIDSDIKMGINNSDIKSVASSLSRVDTAYEIPKDINVSTTYARYDSFKKERLGHSMENPIRYQEAYYYTLFERLQRIACRSKKIRIIGTEEFMYLPVMAGEYLERMGHEVICHSTTRSPIDILNYTEDKGITSSFALSSPYDLDRKTYIYNLDNDDCDMVIVITDSEKTGSIHMFINEMAILISKTSKTAKNIYFVIVNEIK